MENIFNNICYVTVQEKKLISSKYRMQKLYPPMLTPKYHKMNTCSKGGTRNWQDIRSSLKTITSLNLPATQITFGTMLMFFI